MRLLSILLVCCSLSVMAEVRVVDDNGDEVRLAVPAQRIISLAPNITEVLFHIGAGDQIVGADEYSNYPAAAKQILRVNNHAAANYELILSLKPDLVIAWQSGNGDKIINPLRKLGIPVFVVETHQIERIPNLFRRFGQLSGNNDLAAAHRGIYPAFAAVGRCPDRQVCGQNFLSNMGSATDYAKWQTYGQ